jgi:hypothetical protein
MRKYTDITLDQVHFHNHARYIELAIAGDVNAAKLLLSDALVCIQNGVAFPELLASYMAESIFWASLITQPADFNVTADDAFHLNRKPGRDGFKGRIEAKLYCLEVALELKKTGRLYKSGKGSGACDLVGEQYGKAPRTILTLWQKREPAWGIEGKTVLQLREDISEMRLLLNL